MQDLRGLAAADDADAEAGHWASLFRHPRTPESI